MNRQLHKRRDPHVANIEKWLDDLLMQEQDGKLVHHIQSITIVNCYQPHVSTGYLGIVLCNHSEHEEAVEIVQQLAESIGEPPMREQEVPDGE